MGALEVLVMVVEVCSVLPVDELTGLFHILGHARRATAEHPDLPDLEEEVQAGSEAELAQTSSYRGPAQGPGRTQCAWGGHAPCVEDQQGPPGGAGRPTKNFWRRFTLRPVWHRAALWFC